MRRYTQKVKKNTFTLSVFRHSDWGLLDTTVKNKSKKHSRDQVKGEKWGKTMACVTQ